MTVIGLGNVALDCARVLLRRPEDLAATDIAAHALEALRRSSVRRVDVVGRRGAVQVLCGWPVRPVPVYLACSCPTSLHGANSMVFDAGSGRQSTHCMSCTVRKWTWSFRSSSRMHLS